MEVVFDTQYSRTFAIPPDTTSQNDGPWCGVRLASSNGMTSG